MISDKARHAQWSNRHRHEHGSHAVRRRFKCVARDIAGEPSCGEPPHIYENQLSRKTKPQTLNLKP